MEHSFQNLSLNSPRKTRDPGGGVPHINPGGRARYDTVVDSIPHREDISGYYHSKRESKEEKTPKYTYYPITNVWQKEKSRLLDIPLEKYINCADMKQFSQTSPPKQTLTVRGDGNCFFRAISAVVSGSEAEHMTVRTAVTKHVSDHPDMYRTFLLSRGGMTKYISSMKRSREWATDTEIMATATLLRTVIMVYSPIQFGGKTEYHWQTFKPLDNTEMTHPVIYLSNKNEHFDPVLDVETEDTLHTKPKSLQY
ncbi:uncharacterized protein LOC125658480 [Ostrea edulis]|uniref:uncharacterized protein LOC125658480 n=1 Tax=Ostrea edulis TaxID=37623 RepID=UPI0024AF790C|nr:uncharacterized protein LOC125658480 [Ostrea edulis]